MNVQLRVCTGLMVLVCAIGATNVFGASISVATVGTYAASPTLGMTINDATSNGTPVTGITLANFQTLVTAAFAAETGGVINAEDQTAGGTINPGSWRNNNTNYGEGAANVITATYGSTQGNSLGIYRTDTDAAGVPFGINGNTNNAFFASGNSYIGIQGSGSPVNLVFTKGLSALGLTLVPRGALRNVTMTAVLNNAASIVGSTQMLTADNLSGAFFWGFQAPVGSAIVGLNITSPEGFSRFDDLGFVVVPEPASLSLFGLASFGLLVVRRRR